MSLARDQVEAWRPIVNYVCVSEADRSSIHHGPPTWRKNGQSYSCSWCGSMSCEEVEECLLNADVRFALNDRGDKVYVNRYPHAGECPNPPTTCACDVKRGGGPVKFYLWHAGDLIDRDAIVRLYNRIRVRCSGDGLRMREEVDAAMHALAQRIRSERATAAEEPTE